MVHFFIKYKILFLFLIFFLNRKRGMKLGSKGKDVESFVDQLKSEGVKVSTPTANNVQPGSKTPIIKSDVDE